MPIPLVLFVGNLGDDGVMVAGGVAAVGLDPDLGGAVDGLVGVDAALVGSPVAIGENAVVVDGEPWRDKDVVDALLGFEIGVKGYVCAILGKALTRKSVRVLEDATLAEGAEYLIHSL